MQWELFLHALLACAGAYLLARHFFPNRAAAAFTGMAYGLSGFFAAHSSHTPLFQAAAWLPWLLLFFDRALEAPFVKNAAPAVLAAGMMILAGHFQTALYGFLALALYAAGRLALQPGRRRRVLLIAPLIPLGGTLLSAAATLPGLELVLHSIRTATAAGALDEGFLPAGALLTLLYPNRYGAISGSYTGPGDITQYYFYAGILALPLAAVGWRHRAARISALVLVLPCVWYAAGRPAGLYLLVSRLPGFSSIRAPVHIWFVPALGLALLAGAGVSRLADRWRAGWLAPLILTIAAVDLWYWNSSANPLAYARAGYDESYGAGLALFERTVAATQPPLSRFDAPERLTTFGPMNHPLLARVETTYGYNPLKLSAMAEYLEAARTNPKLRNGLNVSRVLDAQRSAIVPNPEWLGRVTIPRELIAVSTEADSRKKLAALDPARSALVPAGIAGLRQDTRGSVEVREYAGDRYRIHYRVGSETLLRISAAWFPGWRAQGNGRRREVLRVDHALIGVVAPAGEGDLTVEYRSNYLAAGALISGAALAVCLILSLLPPHHRQRAPSEIAGRVEGADGDHIGAQP